MTKEKGEHFGLTSTEDVFKDIAQRTKKLREEIRNGKKCWGRWKYNGEPKSNPSLDLLSPGDRYQIEMYRITTDAKLGAWLLHLAGKPWVTADDLGQLVLAIRDLGRAGLHSTDWTAAGC